MWTVILFKVERLGELLFSIKCTAVSDQLTVKFFMKSTADVLADVQQMYRVMCNYAMT